MSKEKMIIIVCIGVASFSAGYFIGSAKDLAVPGVANNKEHTLHTNHAMVAGDRFPPVKIDPQVRHNMGVRTRLVERGDLQRNVETIGKITRVDPTARRIVKPPIKGSLVYLTNKYDGDMVAAGELLFSVISPSLKTSQRAYQQALLTKDSVEAERIATELWHMGMTGEQLAQLEEGRALALPVEVYSPEEGYVFSRRGEVGDAVTVGFTVFNLSSKFHRVEVTAEIFERQWGWIKKGQSASMSVRGVPGVLFHGRVQRVEPPVGYTTRSLEVRLQFKTDHPNVVQNQFARVTVQGKPRHDLLLVASEAVIRSAEGERVVVVHDDGSYQPVAVTTGEASAEKVEVLSGLHHGQRVVVSGQFLIDSESNLLADMKRTGSAGSAHHGH